MVFLLPRGKQQDNFPDWVETTYGIHGGPRQPPPPAPPYTHPGGVCLRANVGITFHGVGYEYILPKRNPNTEK